MARSKPNLLTQAEYARHRKARGLPGGSREAVRKAVDEGRISTIDGLIDPVVADIQWEQNTRARVSPQAATAKPTAPPVGAPGDPVSQGATDDPAVGQPGAAAAGPADKPAAIGVDPGYNIHRAKREKADAEIAAMNAARMAGEMVMREDVDRAIYEIARELRDRLASCARRVAAEVSSLPTAEACEEVIDREHRIVLELLASGSREKLGASPKEAAS